MEGFIEARYSKQRSPILTKLNLQIEKLRFLLRMAHEMQYLSHKHYQHAAQQINEIGKMLGGWIKQQSKL